jgi:hypothetical protein
MINWPTKDPNSRVPYYFDTTAFEASEGSALASYVLAIDSPPDPSLVIESHSRSGSLITLWLEGGTLDVAYVVRCRVTLVNTLVEDLSRELVIASH